VEHPAELLVLIEQGGHLVVRRQFSADGHLEPDLGFVQFLQGDVDLVPVVRLALGDACLGIQAAGAVPLQSTCLAMCRDARFFGSRVAILITRTPKSIRRSARASAGCLLLVGFF